MSSFRPATLIVAAFAFSLAACGREAPAPATQEPLSRAVVTLNTKENTVMVPRTLLVERGGLAGVFVLNNEGVARFRLVRSGHSRDNRVEIVSGLIGNETLVAGNLADVHDGSAITPIK